MFENQAYSALYSYLGLNLQSAIREILISENLFKGILLVIFGYLFLSTTFKFASRYFPSTLVKKRNVPLSTFFKILVFLFLGLSLLKINTKTVVRDFKGLSWHDNEYVKKNFSGVKSSYKVNFFFDILTGTAEEISAFAARAVDKIFSKTHSQLEAPDFFYKSIMVAGTATISDQELKDKIDFYVDECFDRILPLIGAAQIDGKLDKFFFSESDEMKSALSKTILENPDKESLGLKYTCLDLNEDLKAHFYSHAEGKLGNIENIIGSNNRHGFVDFDKSLKGTVASRLLSNHFYSKKESDLGIQEGAVVNDATTGKIFQYFNKIRSFDGILGIFGGKKLHGASLYAERANEFSEMIARAPHIQGLIKLLLIVSFNFLVFAVIAGKINWLFMWFMAYLSVCMWTPVWTFLYHLVTNIGLSTGLMEELGMLNTGIALYSSEVVMTKIYYLYSVYSWLAVILAPLLSWFFISPLRSAFMDKKEETAPEFLDGAAPAATSAIGGFGAPDIKGKS